MNHQHSAHSPSIGHDVITFGPAAVQVHRAQELREARMRHKEIINALGTTRPASGIRHRLGDTMIALGSWLAGATSASQAPQPERMLVPKRGSV